MNIIDINFAIDVLSHPQSGDKSDINKALNIAIELLKAGKEIVEQESVLDKIKTEIKEWYWQADKQALAEDPCVVDAMIDLFIRTIDKYKEGEEWLRSENNKTENGHTLALVPGAVIMPGDRFC